MLNYSEYIVEKLLLESKIILSKDLMTILSIVDDDIARNLVNLSTSEEDHPYVQNYVDKTTDKDMVSFTPDAKVSEIIDDEGVLYEVIESNRYLTHSSSNDRIFQRLGYDKTKQDNYNPPIGTIGTVLAKTHGSTGKTYALFRDTNGRLAVLNMVALDDKSSTKIWTYRRNKMKIGRLAKAVLGAAGVVPTAKELEDFVNKYKSAYDIEAGGLLMFDIVSGQDIAKWYDGRRYERSSSSLGNSCMADVDSDYFDIYVYNPDVCRLVILYSKGGSIGSDGKYKADKIRGRALLWKTRDGSTFMDRIYTNYDDDIELFKKFAKESGFWCKRYQGNDTDGFSAIDPNGQYVSSYNVSVKIEKHIFEYYPYVDTLSYMSDLGGYAILSSDSDYNYDYTLSCTGGGRD